MLTERLPHNTDNDDYIREWAINNNLHMQSVTYVTLLTTCRDAPDTASINWLMPGQPVTRYKDILRSML